MIIECPRCESKVVPTEIVGQKEYPSTEFSEASKYVLVTCPECNNLLLGICDMTMITPDNCDWSEPVRVYPEPHEHLHQNIPFRIQKVLQEAQMCYKSKTYSACAVMCGKALETICADKGTPGKMLQKGLEELKSNGIIDQKLLEWGDALRRKRNIGAHAGDDDVSKQDAKDVLDFLLAISEYVYVLSEQYEEFKQREIVKRKKQEKKKATKK